MVSASLSDLPRMPQGTGVAARRDPTPKPPWCHVAGRGQFPPLLAGSRSGSGATRSVQVCRGAGEPAPAPQERRRAGPWPSARAVADRARPSAGLRQEGAARATRPQGPSASPGTRLPPASDLRRGGGLGGSRSTGGRAPALALTLTVGPTASSLSPSSLICEMGALTQQGDGRMERGRSFLPHQHSSYCLCLWWTPPLGAAL